MYTHAQKLSDPQVQELRKSGGLWLRELREKRGLSQRQLAEAVGADYYTFISQVESGVGRLRDAPHVQNARVRGLPRRTVVARHLMRPGLVPFTARLGVGAGTLAGGVYATEVIFSWPGMGREAVTAARAQDYPLLIAIVLVTGLIVLAANLAAELFVAALDPRARTGRADAA